MTDDPAIEALAKAIRPWTTCDEGGFDHGSMRAAEAVLASGLVDPDPTRRLAAVRAVVADFSARSAAFNPQDPKYKTGQSHLSPAFREVDWKQVSYDIGVMFNEFEAALKEVLDG